MKKYVIGTKHQDPKSVIEDFIFGEELGFAGIVLEREWFDSKEAAEEAKERRKVAAGVVLSVFEINISATEL